ncbi:TetR/AcrR family transcriptional regulator [Novosphingobium profundi]|uniref:TetR/AcrR family transcriptional regulator n=1 Tax=Novosphingobium profundi TaxID=1774954 RepID=UPI001BDA2E05|nr:TetR/AcrR family transcriptional regulator [Novosphingobium profundi]MBT0670187.1 TetR/AcrR family transcriptional regulator [Novosphingobium profundi]
MTQDSRPDAEPVRLAGRPSLEAAQRIEETMLDAALEVFVAQGFRGASMEAIARAAGVTKRTLYRRARTKSALFVDVVERLALRSGVPELAHIKAGPLRQRLEAASEILLGWMLAPEAIALYRLIVADATTHPSLARSVDGPFQRASEALAAILAEGDERPAEVIRMGADMFVRLVAGEALDRAAQGIEPPGVSLRTQDRARVGVAFFLAGWASWER